jgi:hypothetical protein
MEWLLVSWAMCRRGWIFIIIFLYFFFLNHTLGVFAFIALKFQKITVDADVWRRFKRAKSDMIYLCMPKARMRLLDFLQLILYTIYIKCIYFSYSLSPPSLNHLFKSHSYKTRTDLSMEILANQNATTFYI